MENITQPKYQESDHRMEQMEIINGEKPPIWDEAIAAGLRPNPERTVFTFGAKIYNPGSIEISDDLFAHECTHAEQQGYTEDGARAWWSRYMLDPYFRIEQEAEAYGEQYSILCYFHKDRNARARLLHALSTILSSPTYGSVIDHATAKKMILKYSQ